MRRRNLAFLVTLIISCSAYADLDHTVSGDSNIEDVLSKSEEGSNSPYLTNGEDPNGVEKMKAKGKDFMFNPSDEVSGVVSEKRRLNDVGYMPPGSMENLDNYLEVDKPKAVKDIRKASSGGLNLSYIKNDYNYTSTNDIINQTISRGAGHIKGGTLYLRNDSYFFKTAALNTHWSLGGGVGYNSGKGIFVNGQRSETRFNLWEMPIDAALGLEVPVSTWFKIAGTGGGSVLTLLQNRSDYGRGEKGKRKFQFSPGYFANAQFKINLTGFSDNMAYELFTSSEITNMFLNLEVRYQNYSSFKDPITISGTSFGLGFTFEYL